MASEAHLPAGCMLLDGSGGLSKLSIQSGLAEAEIYLHGAHVTRFKPRDSREILWLSGSSLFQSNKAIRGGVPICFPWFGPSRENPSLPQHGFARVTEWELLGVQLDEMGNVIAELGLQSSEATRAVWPHKFSARYRVMVGRSLHLELSVRNLDSSPFTFEEALHSYFAVSAIQQTEVIGLQSRSFADRLQPGKTFTQAERAILFAAETDRTYVDTPDTIIIADRGGNRQIVNEKTSSLSTIVWNPWIAKAKAMADFGDDEWRTMVCVETANVDRNAITLAPGEVHAMSAIIYCG